MGVCSEHATHLGARQLTQERWRELAEAKMA